MYFAAPVWPLKWDPPYDETIRRIHDLGFRGVEMIAWNRDSFEYYTRDTIKRLKSLVRDLDMVISNFNNSPRGIASPDPVTRERTFESFRMAMDTAGALGVQNVTMVAEFPFGHTTKEFPELRNIAQFQTWSYAHVDMGGDWRENYDTYVAMVRRACRHAADLGLRVLIEPHPYRLMNSASSMLRLIEHVGEANLGMNFDPSHLFPQGDMPEWTIHMLKGRIWHTHFSDNDTLTNVHWRPGQGKINWKAVMKALKDTGYNGTINFELEDVGGAATPEAASHGMSDEMEYEIGEAKKYITGICEELGIKLD
jgi:sugar phosphate isomerase/epimerase